jgi:hypothetical protein
MSALSDPNLGLVSGSPPALSSIPHMPACCLLFHPPQCSVTSIRTPSLKRGASQQPGSGGGGRLRPFLLAHSGSAVAAGGQRGSGQFRFVCLCLFEKCVMWLCQFISVQPQASAMLAATTSDAVLAAAPPCHPWPSPPPLQRGRPARPVWRSRRDRRRAVSALLCCNSGSMSLHFWASLAAVLPSARLCSERGAARSNNC